MNLKSFFLILGLFLLAVFLAYILSKSPLVTTKVVSPTPSVTVNNHKIKVVVAKSAQDKEVGLSKYSSLPKDEGMVFPFGTAGDYPFWMKNMKFPIDLIYIKKGKVVTIFENIKPPKSSSESPPIYRSSESADLVLEINAGLSKEYKIKKGTEVKYENFSN